MKIQGTQSLHISLKIHSEVIPVMPRSSAMMTAAFSPIAIAVL